MGRFQPWVSIIDSMSYRKTSHSVYDLKYHIVWITKYRKPILRGAIGQRVRELIRQTSASLEVYIVKGHIAKDHVHLLVSVPPKLSVSEYVKRVKGRSARKLLEEFGEIKRTYWGRHLWARGYFAASTGNVTDEMVAEYIERQTQKSPDKTDDFSVEDEL